MTVRKRRLFRYGSKLRCGRGSPYLIRKEIKKETLIRTASVSSKTSRVTIGLPVIFGSTVSALKQAF